MKNIIPYFKFQAIAWQTGSICLASLEAQGAFMKICSFYWLRCGKLTLAFAKKITNENVVEELLELGDLKNDENGDCSISFLDSQLDAMKSMQMIRAEAGAKGGASKAKQELSTCQYSKSKSKRESKSKSISKGTFQIPTFDDVSQYFSERNNNLNPEQFYDHYESNGWLVGKNRMKDWKAAARQWERNEFTKGSKKLAQENADDEFRKSVGLKPKANC